MLQKYTAGLLFFNSFSKMFKSREIDAGTELCQQIPGSTARHLNIFNTSQQFFNTSQQFFHTVLDHTDTYMQLYLHKL